MGAYVSKTKDQFHTDVELTFVNDFFFIDNQDINNQPLNKHQQLVNQVTIRRTSTGDGSTVYFNGVVQTQKVINQLLKNTYGIDLDKWFIYTNPDILFNTNYTDQKETGKLIFDAVSHHLEDELTDLSNHLGN